MTAVQWVRVSPSEEREHARIVPQSVSGCAALIGSAESMASLENQVFLSDEKGTLSLLKLDAASMSLELEIGQEIGKRYQRLSPFWLGGRLHLLAYSQPDGVFDFFRYERQRFEHIYRFQRTYGDTTDGYTTVHAYSYRNRCLFMAYNQASGMSRIYGIDVPPHMAMNVTQLWQSKWSDAWRHFCFFKLGSENFFFKINQKNKKVNIDHYTDDPSQGAHPVCSTLPQLSLVSHAATIELAEGPGFAAYQGVDGSLTVNRFYADCQGWHCQGRYALGLGFRRLLVIHTGNGECLLGAC